MRRSAHSQSQRRDRFELLADPLRASTAYMLGSVFRQVQREVVQALEEPGLSWAAFAILTVLETPGTLSQGAIVERSGVDRTTVSRTLDDLAEEVLVVRETRIGDGRRREAEITAEGRHWLVEARRYIERGERQALRRLSKRERERLRVLLSRALPPATWSPFGFR